MENQSTHAGQAVQETSKIVKKTRQIEQNISLLDGAVESLTARASVVLSIDHSSPVRSDTPDPPREREDGCPLFLKLDEICDRLEIVRVGIERVIDRLEV